MAMLEVMDLTKSFGRVVANNDISFEIRVIKLSQQPIGDTSRFE